MCECHLVSFELTAGREEVGRKCPWGSLIVTMCFLSVQAQLQLLIFMQTGKVVFLSTYSTYLLRKAAIAAVINNLVLSAALRLFQASQLAAWLSPLLSPSIIRARCRPSTLLLPDHATLSGFLLLQENQLLFLIVFTKGSLPSSSSS